MGNVFRTCGKPQDETIALRKELKIETYTVERRADLVTLRQTDERPVIKANIVPIGGRGPLDSKQAAGAERFGM
jgi:uncharacterized OB-fold protein